MPLGKPAKRNRRLRSPNPWEAALPLEKPAKQNRRLRSPNPWEAALSLEEPAKQNRRLRSPNPGEDAEGKGVAGAHAGHGYARGGRTQGWCRVAGVLLLSRWRQQAGWGCAGGLAYRTHAGQIQI